MTLTTPYGTVDNIIKDLAEVYGATYEDVTGKSRKGVHVIPRQAIMYFLYHECKIPSTYIGKCLNRNHATVLYGVSKVYSMLEIKGFLRSMYEQASSDLKQAGQNDQI